MKTHTQSGSNFRANSDDEEKKSPSCFPLLDQVIKPIVYAT